MDTKDSTPNLLTLLGSRPPGLGPGLGLSEDLCEFSDAVSRGLMEVGWLEEYLEEVLLPAPLLLSYIVPISTPTATPRPVPMPVPLPVPAIELNDAPLPATCEAPSCLSTRGMGSLALPYRRNAGTRSRGASAIAWIKSMLS